MAICENGKGRGAVLLSFLAGAALGAGVALFLAQSEKEDIESTYDEGPLFV